MSGLGLPNTTVEEVKVTDRYMEMIVTLPPSLTLWARLKRILKVVKVAPAVLAELDEQQEQIRASEERFQSLAQSAVDAILTFDENGDIQYWNPATEQLFGFERQSLYNINLGDLLAQWTPQVLQDIKRLSYTNLFEFQGKKSDEKTITVEVSFSRWQSQGETNYTAIIRDISRRKEAEDHLRQREAQYRIMARRLLTIQDEERERISRELRDSMGEYLSTLLLQCGMLRRQLGRENSEVIEELKQVETYLQEAIEECHRISFELNPLSISKFGFQTAAKFLIERISAHTALKIDLELPEENYTLNALQQLTLYRILQESLNNIQRHAAAKTVRIRLKLEDEYICLKIVDDGRGFTLPPSGTEGPDVTEGSGGLGLFSMRERVKALQGNFNIHSEVEKGTTIEARIPLKTNE